MAHSLVVHTLIAILSLFLFIVFARWWIQVNHTVPITKIYKINCFLMLGLFATHSFAAARYAMVLSGCLKLNDAFTWYFSFQHYFILIPLIGYLIHVIDKLKNNKRHHDKQGRRKNDDG